MLQHAQTPEQSWLCAGRPEGSGAQVLASLLHQRGAWSGRSTLRGVGSFLTLPSYGPWFPRNNQICGLGLSRGAAEMYSGPASLTSPPFRSCVFLASYFRCLSLSVSSVKEEQGEFVPQTLWGELNAIMSAKPEA